MIDFKEAAIAYAQALLRAEQAESRVQELLKLLDEKQGKKTGGDDDTGKQKVPVVGGHDGTISQ